MEKDSSLWKEEEAVEIKERIIAALEQVIDPELGIDIVNLGLVYNVHLYENGFCQIDLTLTTMGCPLVDVITDDIIHALKTVPEVTSSEVKTSLVSCMGYDQNESLCTNCIRNKIKKF